MPIAKAISTTPATTPMIMCSDSPLLLVATTAVAPGGIEVEDVDDKLEVGEEVVKLEVGSGVADNEETLE